MKTSSGQSSLDSRWLYLDPTDFCQFSDDGTTGHLPILKRKKLNVFFICTNFSWTTTASMNLSNAHFLVLFQKSLKSKSWNPRLLWNLLADAVELPCILLLCSVLPWCMTCGMKLSSITYLGISLAVPHPLLCLLQSRFCSSSSLYFNLNVKLMIIRNCFV